MPTFSTIDWPRHFGDLAEEAPDGRTLCKSIRQVTWRLRPRTRADIGRMLAAAAAHKTSIYAVSAGLNWGYGSHLPGKDLGVILDLSRLANISDFNRETLTVQIEPGVTQGDLAKFLKAEAPDLFFNNTGSGLQTSVLGNALDRGIGYFGEKERDIFGLEIMLADGTVCCPGPESFSLARSRPAGPDMDSPFFQSNLGVVLAARLRLRIRQQTELALVMTGPLPGVIATLKAGYDNSLLRFPARIGEPGRSRRVAAGLLLSVLGRAPTEREVEDVFPERSGCTALVPIHGRKRVGDAVCRELSALAAPGVRLQRLSAKSLDRAVKWLPWIGCRRMALRLRAIRPLLALTWGEPSDAGLTSLEGPIGSNPDHSTSGAIYGNAIAPASHASAERIRTLVCSHWPDAAFTWQILDSACLIAIYTLHFPDVRVAAARTASALITDQLFKSGFPPYRLHIDTPLGGPPLFSRLKRALDPESILAPGRYE